MTAAVIAMAVAQPASAQVVDEYEYKDGRVYVVRTGLGLTTQIELDPTDEVRDYSTGFSNGWELIRRDHVFYLKPKNVDVDTNLLVRTERRSYIFELKVVATDWIALEQARQAGVQYKVSFRYPQDQAPVAAAGGGQAGRTRLARGRVYHFDYEYATRTRKKWLVPVNVYDDGKFTYVRVTELAASPTGNFPAVFARHREDGEDFVVNTTVEGSTIVIHGTYPYLVIRHGNDVVGLRRNASR
ncbi:TrbG/VirB9 family P-type conjugative transfer protein [Vulcaniibacterium gelatinicum]|uniref:TrbG/VirB9 family P-type conjugative transfer protein n=1 Tax=Vulcaniibacterium gelatinicum TaxID=2598725 RepID=UPI003CCC833B